MVLLGGLEFVAAGYIIHKHQQNKKDRERLKEEEAALEESRYRIFPPDDRHSSSEHRRHRSHSRRRHSSDRKDSRERRHSRDGRRRRESPRPAPRPSSTSQVARPPTYNSKPASAPPPLRPSNSMPAPVPQSIRPPTFVSTPPPQPPQQDVKYGWTDDGPAQPPQQANPPTGWPAHWAQSQTPDPASLAPRTSAQRGSTSRGRSETRTPRVRFADERHTPTTRSLSRSPPPSYRP